MILVEILDHGRFPFLTNQLQDSIDKLLKEFEEEGEAKFTTKIDFDEICESVKLQEKIDFEKKQKFCMEKDKLIELFIKQDYLQYLIRKNKLSIKKCVGDKKNTNKFASFLMENTDEDDFKQHFGDFGAYDIDFFDTIAYVIIKKYGYKN